MIDWKTLTPDARNQLIAVHLFGWKPEPCPPGAQAVWSDHALLYLCSMCGAGGETPEQIEHQSINAYPRYSESMDAAWLIIEKMKEPDPESNARFVDLTDEIEILTHQGDDGYYMGQFVSILRKLTPELICIAALNAIGLEIE